VTEYLYRVVWRVKFDVWGYNQDPALNVWQTINNRSYKTLSIAKGIRTSVMNNPWHKDHEIKIQRYPLTQQWEDVNGI